VSEILGGATELSRAKLKGNPYVRIRRQCDSEKDCFS